VSSQSLPFSAPDALSTAPLAERLRPQHLDEVIGQAQLLGPGKPLRVAFESGRLHSMILWGPPGTGKTTLARLVATAFDAQFIAMSAVLGGVKEIREAVERAQVSQASGRRTVVFVDEVHRFNKSQQDAFLPHVESGLFTLIGATTENPSFEVNSALLSRSTVHVLKSLTNDDMAALLLRAQALLQAPAMTSTAQLRLIGYADGDARRLLNAYENLVATAGLIAEIDEAQLEQSLGEHCDVLTKAASSSTTAFLPCTKPCVAATPMRRSIGLCACSTAVSTLATPHAAWCAWPVKTSAWPIRALCA
jgi:putative ATPase